MPRVTFGCDFVVVVVLHILSNPSSSGEHMLEKLGDWEGEEEEPCANQEQPKHTAWRMNSHGTQPEMLAWRRMKQTVNHRRVLQLEKGTQQRGAMRVSACSTPTSARKHMHE